MDNSLLLVDDDVGILKALKRLLTRSGYSVKTAQSGEEALNLLLTYDCKVVLTDFRMPYMDGGLLLSKIKRLYPEVVGLVISGYSDFESVKSLLNAGSAYRFLQKPWEDNELLDEIANAFTHHNKQIFQRQSQKCCWLVPMPYSRYPHLIKLCMLILRRQSSWVQPWSRDVCLMSFWLKQIG